MIYIKKLFILLAGVVILFSNCQSTSVSTTEEDEYGDISEFIMHPQSTLPIIEFKENWVYVVAGRESSLIRDLPITDIAYFGAEVDSYGKITDVPKRAGIPSFFKGRVHLVIACSSRSLTHFVLKPGSQERKEYIADIIAAAKNFDGVNVDLELVPGRDGEAFVSFLRELREGLPSEKMFTICVPARTRKLNYDVYDYEKLTPLVDRVFVMAYDEHWSGSRPGSVASIGWCRSVAQHSLRTIGAEKLIMGLPFYGRAWGDYSPSRALIYSSIENIIKEHHIKDIRYENGVPTFTYNKNVLIKLYYEDEYSLVSRLNMYKTMGVNSVGFWRLGQETAEIWKYIKITEENSIASPITRNSQIRYFTPTSAQTAAVTPLAPGAVAVPASVTTTETPVPQEIKRYTVKRGDSLWAISRRYGITMQALADANGMRVNDTLRIGKVLRIPE